MVEAISTMYGDGDIVKQSIYELSTEKNHRLGTRVSMGDGRVFRYCSNATVALSAGKLIQGAAPYANHLNRPVHVAVAVGAKKVQVEMGATAAAANFYTEGYLHCNDVSPEGYIYKVKSHAAIAGSDNVWINLYDPVAKAMTATTSEVTLTRSPYDSVIIAPLAALTQVPVGVPIIDITASTASVIYYFWAQTWGPCAVLTQGTVVIGQNVVLGGTADGAIGPSTGDVLPVVGWTMQVNTSTDYSLIFLVISP